MTPPGSGVALATLLQRLPRATVTGSTDALVRDITTDSRAVRRGSLFVALAGERFDGHAFLAQAIASGAVAVVVERGRGPDEARVAVVEVERTRAALSALAAAFFGDPSRGLRVVGVTGTNGKTTTTHMIAAVFSAAGTPCGVLGTVGAHFGGRHWELAHTTPFPQELHGVLAEMRAAGARAVAMEVSSHALALERVEDVHFSCAVLTNVTRDHLDFHGTQEAYAAAKRRLFAMTRAAVLNAGDEAGALWSRELRGTLPVLTYALGVPADLVPRDVRATDEGSAFVLDGIDFTVPLPGRFNVENALAAIGVGRTFGVGDADAAAGLAALPPVRGRMERISGRGIDVVVDYAHTPDALAQALGALREGARGRVAVVFGCGGDRDRGKRPEMGAVAARLADRIYVTNDNPRTEDPLAIARGIVEGIGAHPHVLELDRAAAIARAIADASPGDVVLVAGKGHETYQILGTRRYEFDDAAVVRAALAGDSR